jgi:hypothetical protein
LDRCQSREEVIDASSRIRKENANAGLHGDQKGQHQGSKKLTALTSKEMQMLFTEQSPRHFTSEMIVAKLSYAGDGVSRSAKTEAMLKGDITPSLEAQKLVDSLESRMERKYVDDSLAATKHFLQSLKTPDDELRYKNSFDHRALYRKLSPAERDFVYQRATEQKEQLETTARPTAQELIKNGYEGFETTRPKLQIEKLQETMKMELLAVHHTNHDRERVEERANGVLTKHLELIGMISTNEEARSALTRDIGQILLGREYQGSETGSSRMQASHAERGLQGESHKMRNFYTR